VRAAGKQPEIKREKINDGKRAYRQEKQAPMAKGKLVSRTAATRHEEGSTNLGSEHNREGNA